MSESMDDEDSAYAQQQAVYYHQAHDLVSALYDAAIKYGRDKCHEEACEVADAMIAASTGVNVVQFDALCKVLVRACTAFAQANNLSPFIALYAVQQTVATTLDFSEQKKVPTHVN